MKDSMVQHLYQCLLCMESAWLRKKKVEEGSLLFPRPSAARHRALLRNCRLKNGTQRGFASGKHGRMVGVHRTLVEGKGSLRGKSHHLFETLFGILSIFPFVALPSWTRASRVTLRLTLAYVRLIGARNVMHLNRPGAITATSAKSVFSAWTTIVLG